MQKLVHITTYYRTEGMQRKTSKLQHGSVENLRFLRTNARFSTKLPRQKDRAPMAGKRGKQQTAAKARKRALGKRQKEKNKSSEMGNFAHKNENGWTDRQTKKIKALPRVYVRMLIEMFRPLQIFRLTRKKKSFLEKRSAPINS